MDIWVKSPSDRKGLNGMNEPCAVSMALYHMQSAVIELAEAALNRKGKESFGLTVFENVSFDEARELASALYTYGTEYGLHRRFTFYFSNDQENEETDNKERETFKSAMMHGYPCVITNKFQLITSADITRDMHRQHAAIDEFTEQAENTFWMPSNPERDA